MAFALKIVAVCLLGPLRSLLWRLLTIKALALLARQAVIDVELLETITQILRQRVWQAEASSSMAYFVNVLHMSEDSVVRRCNAAALLDRYPHIVKPMLEAREIHLTGLSMLHAVIDDRNAEILFAEARGKSKKAIEAICCRIQPKPTLQPYIRRIATRDDGAPVRDGDEELFTHAARFLMTDFITERLDEAFNLVAGADLNDIMARAIDMFVERTSMAKRRVLKQTKAVAVATAKTAAVKRAAHTDNPMPQPPAPVRASELTLGEAHDSELLKPRVGNGEANAADSVDHLPDDTLVPVGPLTHTRYVTAKVSRAGYVRDGRRCQFDLLSGGKCLSPRNPQLHHKENYAWGGEATEESLTVYCKVHNLYQAELDFGPWTKRA